MNVVDNECDDTYLYLWQVLFLLVAVVCRVKCCHHLILSASCYVMWMEEVQEGCYYVDWADATLRTAVT